MTKLHLGAGAHHMKGWLNLDAELPRGLPEMHGFLQWIAPERIPAGDAEIDYVFSEHFLEHLTLEDGERVLAEAYRVLKPGGVLRLSTPDLARIVKAYEGRDLRYAAAVGFVPATPAQLVDTALRGWGHKFLFDNEELERIFRKAGFKNIWRRPVGQSPHAELHGLECRPDLGDLVMEGEK